MKPATLAVARAVPRAERNLVDTVQDSPRFTTLSYALGVSMLDEVLRGKGPFTFFAPTDEAFRKMPPDALEALMQDPPRLRALLSYHVLVGAFASRDLRHGEARTLEGTSLRLGATDDGHTVDYANVDSKDMHCENGIIHEIDAVLIPGYVAQASAAAMKESPWSGRRRHIAPRL